MPRTARTTALRKVRLFTNSPRSIFVGGGERKGAAFPPAPFTFYVAFGLRIPSVGGALWDGLLCGLRNRDFAGFGCRRQLAPLFGEKRDSTSGTLRQLA